MTTADRGSEAIIRQILINEFPRMSFRRSGGTDAAAFSGLERVWIVDPLDGTTNYVRGFTDYGISIAFYEKGRPLIG